MEIKKISLIFVFVLILLLGCVSKPKVEEKPVIRMGYLVGTADQETFAMYNDYFKEEGLNISWEPFRGGSRVVEAAISKQVDGGAIGSVPSIIIAVSKGVPLKIVAVGAIETKEESGDRLVALKKSNINSIEDLRGKKIAVHRFGTTLDLTLRIALKKHGIDPKKDVTLVQVPIQNMVQVLLRGDVDAAFIFPHFYPLVKENVTVLLTPGDVFPKGGPISVIFFSESFIEEHPEEVSKFVNAYLKGISWANENPDKTPEVVVEYTSLSREIAEQIPWPALNPSGRSDPETYDMMINGIRDYDPTLLEKNVTGEDLLDNRFLPS